MFLRVLVSILTESVVYWLACTNLILEFIQIPTVYWGRRDRDRMVVGFTTTYVIGAYLH
jgi:hypothetical protein